MNTKIKLFGVTMIAALGLFAGANLASAQSTTLNTCSSATLNGTITDTSGVSTSAWFEWAMNYNDVANNSGTRTATQYYNYPQNYSQMVYGLNQATTYYYRAVVSNMYGSAQGGIRSFTTPACNVIGTNYTQPYISTNNATSVSGSSATLNGYVAPNGINTNTWFEWGTTTSFGNTTGYTDYSAGSRSYTSVIYGLNQGTTYYYRAVAQSGGGLSYGNTVSFTTWGTPIYNVPVYNNYVVYGSAPTASTLLATELTGTTARLNGLVFISGSQSSTAWFEWGTTTSLGNTTQSVNVGALPTVKHSDYVTGLVQGQKYYFRIVAQNSYGTSYGTLNSFVSQASTYTVAPTPAPVVIYKPIVTPVTQASSDKALVSLAIEGGADMVSTNEKRTYHIAWKNESKQALKNVILRVTFPTSIIIDSATKGAFSSGDNAVIVDLKTLDVDESGDTFIFTTTGKTLTSGELLVVTANMVYTDTKGVQGDALAYVTQTAQSMMAPSVNTSASIFGAGDFVPSTLIGWVLLITMVLVLVFLGNHLYGRFAEQN